jgi:hypothetical protein
MSSSIEERLLKLQTICEERMRRTAGTNMLSATVVPDVTFAQDINTTVADIDKTRCTGDEGWR